MGDPTDSASAHQHQSLRIARLRPSEKPPISDDGLAARPADPRRAARVTSASSAPAPAHAPHSAHRSKYDISPELPQTLAMPSFPDPRTPSRGESQYGSAPRSRKSSVTEQSKRRSQKIRHGGGFLLSDGFALDGQATSREKPRGSRSAKGKAVAGSRSGSMGGLGFDLEPASISKAISMPHMTSAQVSATDSYGISSVGPSANAALVDSPTNASAGPSKNASINPSANTSIIPSSSSHHPPDTAVVKPQNAHPDAQHVEFREPEPSAPLPIEIDSAQIVDMALRINHSRRLSAQASVSPQMPSRIGAIPTVSTAPNNSTLRHHLQQRRISRTSSPRPDRNINGHRLSVGSGKNPLMVQAPFEALVPLESAYKYQFSQSTLTRVQKARNYMELMWQYRLLLEALPPVSVGPVEDQHGRLGRPFNPLQYIRNRKVRARERKAIDGELQGFADVVRVCSWVERIKEHKTLVPFETADSMILERTPVSTSKSQVSNKPNRPRLDWEVEPADLIADIYWLEQADNKKYLQNREWKPIFPASAFQQALPPPPSPPQPQPQQQQQQQPQLQPQQQPQPSQQAPHILLGPSESLTGISSWIPTDSSTTGITSRSTTNTVGKDDQHQISETAALDNKPGFESDHGTSKAGKALHKLHGFKPGHKHSSSNFSHHDIRWRGRSSLSDDSDSELEIRFRPPNRRGTLTSYGKDILEKQMLDRMAQALAEQQRQEQQQQQQQQHGLVSSPVAVSDESKPVSRLGSCQGSVMELSEVDEKPVVEKSAENKHTASPRFSPRERRPGPVMSSRNSLEVPPFTRPSLENDSFQSRPVTPEFLDVSDSSRPPSPSRNPFHRVKSILRDRSREHTRDQSIERVPEEPETATDPAKHKEAVLSPTHSEKDHVEFAKPSKSSTLRTETGANSNVREMLRLPGTRIDSAIRGSLSKIGGLIWRRDDASDSDSSDAVTPVPSQMSTEAESMLPKRSHTPEPSGLGTPEPRRPKTPESSGSPKSPEPSGLGTPIRPSLMHSQSRQSSRLVALKPPRIDIQAASPRNTSQVDLSVSPIATPTPTATPTMPNMVHIPLRLQLLMEDPIALRPQRTTDSESPLATATPTSQKHAPISRRELARMRALILSTGIRAMEATRFSQTPQLMFIEAGALPNMPATEQISTARMLLQDVARLSKNTPYAVSGRRVSLLDFHATAAHTLHAVLVAQESQWHVAATRFRQSTTPKLHAEIDAVRGVVATDLLELVRQAADDADEANRNMVMSQGLKAKRAEEAIDKMLRRKRRRFRWLRRGMWLGVEWMLVGIMWSVWLVVTVVGAVMGMGRGIGRAVRWLCWL
ncbi:hypothetical protein TD95_004382 [Thielaviopsis punctulata]|uniref:Uncharacterized protein n=1 Tax=Thielaviopsis punctulata TaxID=72032 RepID=A0A0F4ZJ93_9PEZI|nr:hypothetical protein TD95_004382 [Thielaviopsis punctulata]